MRKLLLLLCFLGFFVACETTPEEIAVTSVAISPSSLEMIVGESAQLYVTILPSVASNKTVIWTSSKQSVATVTNSGMVTALSEGTSTVSAMAGGVSANCVVTVSNGIVAVLSIAINPASLALDEGESAQLTAIVSPDNATDKTITWSSSDATIASVENGSVTAHKEGTAIITAQAGDKSASCVVKVSKKTIPVESIELNKTSLNLTEGESETLTATLKPDNATDKTVTWSSSDSAIASVENGNVTAHKEGIATITAKAGDKSATCIVSVSKNDIPVESIFLNLTSLTIEEGQTAQLIASINPSNASDRTLTWSSDNESVATVNQEGWVTAIKTGTANISAHAGGKTASCRVTVTDKVIPVTSVMLNKTTLSLEKGKSETLIATVKPDDATDKTVSWSSSDNVIATVDQNGKVTANKGGTAIIKASSGSITASCTVTVSVPVKSITINYTYIGIIVGETISLTATVNPDDADEKTVTWSSSNTAIASVDGDGTVKGVSVGTATIYAKAGQKSASCQVTVSAQPIPVSSVSLNKTEVSLMVGNSFALSVTINPSNATVVNGTVWTSSNPSVATVDSSGKITAISKGSAAITVNVDGKTASCVVTCEIPSGGNEGIGEDIWL